jgi:hypothetical protein
MINEARYSFTCQLFALSEVKKSGDFFYSPLCFEGAISSMLSAIGNGVNILVNNPEALANRIQKNNLKTKSLSYGGPMAFPYESLCLWHTPTVYDINNPTNTQKCQHLVHVQRINDKAIYINYAFCESTQKIDRIGGELDFSWVLVPYGILFILPKYTLFDTPVLPLPPSLEWHTRLRQAVIDVKTGVEPDGGMALVSLLKDKSEDQRKEALQTIIPGVFEVFLGFLDHLVDKTLIQTPGNEEKLVVPDPEHASDMIFSDINYQRVELKI